METPPAIAQQLNEEQLTAVKMLGMENRGIAWWKVGEGKTRIAIAWMFKVDQQPRPLIICSPQAFRTWEDEIEKVKAKGLVTPAFLSFARLSGKTDIEIDFEAINCVVLDEGWLYKNHESKRSRMVINITRRLPSVLLSGSMMTARNIEDIYGQAKAVGLAEKISPNITAFRREFCIAITNFAGFIDRYPKKGAVQAIQSRLMNNIHVYFPKERREIRNIPIRVEPFKQQVAIKRDLVQRYYYAAEKGGTKGFQIEINSATTLLVKLQQISDGFLHDGQGNFLSVRSAKSVRLVELCSELFDAGERVLIWVAFKKTAEELSKILPCENVVLSSGRSFDWQTWHSGRAQACIATVGSGASLNDFADLRYAIFYSTSYNYLQVQQAKGRTNRKGHAHGLYYYYLKTVGFPDEEVWDMLDKSRNAEEYVVATINRLLAAEAL